MRKLLFILLSLLCFTAHGQRTPRVVDSVAALVALTPSASVPDVVLVATNSNTRLQFRYYPASSDSTNAATPFIYATSTGTGRWKEVPLTGTLTGPLFATDSTFSYATASTVPYFNGSKQLVSSAVTPTQLGYLDIAAGRTGTANLVYSTAPTISGATVSGSLIYDLSDESSLSILVDYGAALNVGLTSTTLQGRARGTLNIATLTNFVAPPTAASMGTISVQGYASANDGGGGDFRLVAYSDVVGTAGAGGIWFQSANDPAYAWKRVSDRSAISPEWFGAVPYTVAFSPYFNESLATNLPGTGDFSIWIDWQVPTYSADTTFSEGVLRLQGSSGLGRDIEAYGSTNSFEILVRSTTGSSSTGAGAGKVIGTPNPFLAYQGTRIQMTVVRTNGIFAVYRGTNDITGSFSPTNPSDLAGEIGNGDTSGILSTSPTSLSVPRQPVFAVRQFASALTLTQIAAAGSATNYVATVASLNTATSFTDSGPAIQAALDYARDSGIGTVQLSGGQYFTGQQINVPTRVTLTGLAPSQWSGGSPRMNNPTKLSALWSATTLTNLVSLNAANADLTYRNLNTTFGDGSYGTNYYMGSSVRNLWLDTSAVRYATPLDIYKVSNVKVSDVSVQQWDGPMFRVYQGNAVAMEHVYAARSIGTLRPPYIIQTADSYFEDFDYGGFEGTGLLLFGNKNKISGNFIWNAQAFSTAQTAPTVDTGADTFAATGHRFFTGMPVRFAANGGTLPSPLSPNTLYYVVRVTADTFGVNSQYDAGAAGGALQSVLLNLTTGGSGSWRVLPYVPEEANLSLFDCDDNKVLGGRFDQSFGAAVRLDQSRWNTVTANLVEAGYNNATNIPSVFITGGGSNIVTGSVMGRTRSASLSDIGVLITNSVNNVIRDNVYVNQTYKVVGDTVTAQALPDIFNDDGNVTIANAAQGTSASTGFLYVPATSGTPIGTPTAYTGQVPITFDAANRLLYWWDGSNWQKWQFYPTTATGSVLTDANGSMTLTQTNAAPITITSIGGLSTTARNAYSADLGNAYGVRDIVTRYNGTPSAPTGLVNGQTIFTLQGGGHDGVSASGAAGEIELVASENWTNTAHGTLWNFKTTPTASTTRATVLSIGGNYVAVTGTLSVNGLPALSYSGTPSTGMIPVYTNSAWTVMTPGSSGIGGSTGSTDNSMLRADGTGGATLQNSALTLSDETVNSSQYYVQISAAGAQSNNHLVLAPKATGGVKFGPPPNNGANGGNNPGTYSFNTQSINGSAAQAATGTSSGIFGGKNNTASAEDSVVVGGEGNVSSGGYGSVAGGYYSTVSGTFGAVGIGSALTVSGRSSAGFGYQANTDKLGQLALSSGRFAANGDAQGSMIHVKAATSSTTPTVLTDALGASITVPANTTWAFTAIVAKRTATATMTSAGYKLEGVIERGVAASTTAIVGTVTVTVLAEDAAGDTITAVANAAGTLDITATAADATAARWSALVTVSEVAFP